MGGNIGHGNHSPFAEYNIAGDPEAAQVSFILDYQSMLLHLKLATRRI